MYYLRKRLRVTPKYFFLSEIFRTEKIIRKEKKIFRKKQNILRKENNISEWPLGASVTICLVLEELCFDLQLLR